MKSIIDKIYQIAEYKQISINEFSKKIGVSSGYLAKQRSNQANIGSHIILKIVSIFPDISLDWLFRDSGSMLHSKSTENSIIENDGINDGIFDGIQKVQKMPSFEESRPEVVDTSGFQLIPVADINVAAGSGWFNADHFDKDDVISLPPHLLTNGYHLCVRVKGESMAPTLQDSSYVIIRLLERSEWESLRDEHIHVVTDKEGKAYLKRVKNRIERGFITLKSDSPDRASYPNFNLEVDEIHTIWHAEWYLSARMPNIHDRYYRRLQRVEDRVDELEDVINRSNQNKKKKN